MVELLKQGQFVPFNITDQVISIYAGTQGILDDVPVNRVREFEVGLLAHFKDMAKAVRDELEQKKALDPALEAKLKDEMGKFKSGFMKKA